MQKAAIWVKSDKESWGFDPSVRIQGPLPQDLTRLPRLSDILAPSVSITHSAPACIFVMVVISRMHGSPKSICATIRKYLASMIKFICTESKWGLTTSGSFISYNMYESLTTYYWKCNTNPPPPSMWAFDNYRIHCLSKHTARTRCCIRIRHSLVRSYHPDWALWDSRHPTHLFNILWAELKANLSCICYRANVIWLRNLICHSCCMFGIWIEVFSSTSFPMIIPRCKLHVKWFLKPETFHVRCDKYPIFWCRF